MPRRFPVRFKLTAALAVPTVVLLVLAGSKVVETRDAARRAHEQAELALSTTGPRSLLRNLQAERNLTGAYLLDAVDLVDLPFEEIGDVRPVVDEALVDFQAEIDRTGGAVEGAYQPALDAMSALSDLRRRVDDFPGRRGLDNLTFTQEVFDGYSALVDELFGASRRVSVAVDDSELRRGAELVNLATRQSDTIAQLVRALLLAAVGGDADGVNRRSELTAVQSLLTELRGNEAELRSNAEGPYRRYVEELFASEPVQAFPQHVETALDVGTVDISAVLATATAEGAFGYDALLDVVAEQLERKADDVTDDARRTRDTYAAFGIAMALVVLAVTWLVSRSITRPLRSLTRQATEMADERLPGVVLDVLERPLGEDVTVPEMPPIEISTRDEVGDVAAALNTVQRSALDLAVEQAVLRRNIADSFVNLGRRNQNLLSRQLDFITELERNEANPDTLASLFRLDHLATRMRRNAESLLVLAGVDPPRQWAAPVPVLDVIRAALSEVEDYQRVTVRSVEPVTIVGSAAAGLAHLLAELMENALTFSPPDLAVEVRGRVRPTGYVLAVIDFGVGMTGEELERANRRLAGDEAFTVAPSKYLGHYVTGFLAARHGIEVKVQSSAALPSGGGVTATISLPPALLTTAPAATPGEPLRAVPAGASAGPGAVPAGASAEPATVAARGVTTGAAAGSPAVPSPGVALSGPAAPPAAPAVGASPPVPGPLRVGERGTSASPGTATPGASGAAQPGASVRQSRPRPAPIALPSRPEPVDVVPVYRPAAPPPPPSVPPAPSPEPAERVEPAEPAEPEPAVSSPAGSEPPPTASRVGRIPDDELLRTLANYRVDSGTYRVNSTSYRIDWGRPESSGLAQRVPGSHLPDTEPVKVRRAPAPESPGPASADPASTGSGSAGSEGPPGAGAPAETPARGERQLSDDVYAFLAQFDTGTHGLDEARRSDEQPPADAG